jgi:hypothetical protein
MVGEDPDDWPTKAAQRRFTHCRAFSLGDQALLRSPAFAIGMVGLLDLELHCVDHE